MSRGIFPNFPSFFAGGFQAGWAAKHPGPGADRARNQRDLKRPGAKPAGPGMARREASGARDRAAKHPVPGVGRAQNQRGPVRHKGAWRKAGQAREPGAGRRRRRPLNNKDPKRKPPSPLPRAQKKPGSAQKRSRVIAVGYLRALVPFYRLHRASRFSQRRSTSCWKASIIHSLPGLKRWAKRPCIFRYSSTGSLFLGS